MKHSPNFKRCAKPRRDYRALALFLCLLAFLWISTKSFYDPWVSAAHARAYYNAPLNELGEPMRQRR